MEVNEIKIISALDSPSLKFVPFRCCVHVVTGVSVVQADSWILFAVNKRTRLKTSCKRDKPTTKTFYTLSEHDLYSRTGNENLLTPFFNHIHKVLKSLSLKSYLILSYLILSKFSKLFSRCRSVFPVWPLGCYNAWNHCAKPLLSFRFL